MLDFIIRYVLLCRSTNGAVAHLARAIEWHSIGSRFKSDQLQTATLWKQGVVSFPEEILNPAW